MRGAFAGIALTVAVLGHAHAETDGDLIRRVMERGIERYDALGRGLYEDYMKSLSDHHAEFCRKVGEQTCPPADRMGGVAIMKVKEDLVKQLDIGRRQMAVQLGGDANAEEKASDIFRHIQEFVLEDMDKLGR